MKRILYILTVALLPIVAQGQVTFSHPGGFYTDTFSLSMTMAEPTCTIHYTLNGCVPTADDPQYTEPLPMSTELYSRSELYRIVASPRHIWHSPDSVEHAIVVRAALFDSQGQRCSKVTTATYFIDTLLGRHISLPVVSLCVDSAALFDHDTGIYVPGALYDSLNWEITGNYCQHGREWERWASFTFYNHDSTSISQTCGLRIRGASQRLKRQKSFSLYSRAEYGAKKFNYRFFVNRSQTSYKRLALRGWDATYGWDDTGVNDWLCQKIADSLLCDNLASRPVALFINGEYWGIYFLSEKADEHYIEEHHGVDHDDVDLLSWWDGTVESGSADRWQSLWEWFADADLTTDDNYRYLADKIDMDAIIDYIIAEVFVSNVDWPGNNLRFWSTPETKWRWIFYDADAALSLYRPNSEILGYLTCDDSTMTYPSSPYATLLFRQLLSNAEFRNKAIERFHHLASTAFAYGRTRCLLDTILDLVEAEVPHQQARFDNGITLEIWRTRIDYIYNYLEQKAISMPTDFADHVGINSTEQPFTRIFPNPTKGQAMLYLGTATGDITIGIYDIYGHTAGTINSNGQSCLVLPTLPRGVYLIHVGNTSIPLRWVVL